MRGMCCWLVYNIFGSVCLLTLLIKLFTYTHKSNKTLVIDLSDYTALFRSPRQLAALDQFFIEHSSKSHVLKSMQHGFKSHFEYAHPPPWGHVENYPPLLSVRGRQKLRETMRKQVLQGKMIGGPGWSKHHISSFFGEHN